MLTVAKVGLTLLALGAVYVALEVYDAIRFYTEWSE